MTTLQNETDNKIPKKLFKYKSIDKNNHTIDLIKTDLLYIGTVKEFNDIFEGILNYDSDKILKDLMDSTLKRLEERIDEKEYNKIINSDNPLIELKKWAYKSVKSNNNFKEFSELLDKTFKYAIDKGYIDFNELLINNMLVSCFTEENNNPLMWGNYADNNKGICIEYNIHDSQELLYYCRKVRYHELNEYRDYTSILHPLKPDLDLRYDIFLNKRDEWSYEKEWRLLFFLDGFYRAFIKKINSNYYVKLPKPRRIYLGVNINGEEKRRIKEICEDRNISLIQMKTYKLDYVLSEELRFPNGNWDDINYIKECIKTNNLKTLLWDYFFFNRTLKDHEIRNCLLIKAFNELNEEDISKFLDNILFKKGIFVVLNPYYYNISLFLIQLNKCETFKNIKTKDGFNIEENLQKWIKSSLREFSNEKILKYLHTFELLLECFYSRYLILNENDQNYFAKKLGYEIDLDYVQRVVYERKDKTKYFHPLVDPDYRILIKRNILNNLNQIFKKVYDDGKFDEEICSEEINKLKNLLDSIIDISKKEFQEIYKHSKNYIPLTELSIIKQNPQDMCIKTTCHILSLNKDIINLLSNTDKQIFKKYW